jgi:hypothetical protein
MSGFALQDGTVTAIFPGYALMIESNYMAAMMEFAMVDCNGFS